MQAELYANMLHRARFTIKHYHTEVYIYILTDALYRVRFRVFTFTSSARSYRALSHWNIQRIPVSTRNLDLHATDVLALPTFYNRSSQDSNLRRPESRRNLPCASVALKESSGESQEPNCFPLRVVCCLTEAKSFWVPTSHQRIEHYLTVHVILFLDPCTRGSSA